MAWNDTTKILTAPFTKIAANGQGDLQKALKTAQMSEINIFKYGVWSKWAKYKYLKDPDVIRMTAARRVALNQGFACNDTYSDRTSFYHSSAEAAFLTARAMLSDGVVDWAYDRPTTDTTDENMGQYYPLRPYDFLNDADIAQSGYNGNVRRPFAKVAFGQAANSPSGTWWFEWTFHYLYIAGGIALADLDAFASRQNQGGWYWGVLYRHNNGGSVNFAWLTTEAGGSEKIAVGTPPQFYISGYMSMPVVSGASAIEAYLVAACKSASGDSTIGFINLPIEDASCDITNPAAELHFSVAAYQDPRQGSSPKVGVIASYRTNSSGVVIVNEASHPTSLRVVMSGIADFVDGKSGTWNIRVTAKLSDSSGAYREAYVDYALDCSNPPSSGIAYIDIDPIGSNPLPATSGPGSVRIVLSIRIAAEQVFYVNPINGYVYNTESQATTTLAEIYAANFSSVTFCVYHDADNNTYDPPTYP